MAIKHSEWTCGCLPHRTCHGWHELKYCLILSLLSRLHAVPCSMDQRAGSWGPDKSGWGTHADKPQVYSQPLVGPEALWNPPGWFPVWDFGCEVYALNEWGLSLSTCFLHEKKSVGCAWSWDEGTTQRIRPLLLWWNSYRHSRSTVPPAVQNQIKELTGAMPDPHLVPRGQCRG